MQFEQLANIPHEMRNWNQWVCWKYEDRGSSKPTKVPYCPITGRLAAVNNPGTWSDLPTAIRNCQKHFNGIGFVLTKDDPFCFIDFDATTDPKEVELQKTLYEQFDSYSEQSPSLQGLHIICKATVPSGRRRGAFEIYSDSRFMTVTGLAFGGYRDPKYKQILASSLWEQLGRSNEVTTRLDNYDRKSTNTDLEIYNFAQYAENGFKFLTLWNGDIQTYHAGDWSKADFALVDILAFYTQDRAQIARMFRQSGLGQRAKAKRDDYVELMISKAFDNIVPEVDVSGLLNKFNDFMADNGKVTLKVEHKPLFVPQPLEELAPASGAPFTVPPGLLGNVAKFIHDQSYKPVPEIATVGAIGMMAGICGRAYNISNTGLNQYLLLLAGTGRGKEEMARGIGKLFRSVQHLMPSINDFEGPADLASGQGLLRFMSDHPTKSFCSVFGEFGIRLKAISSQRAMASDLMLQKVMLDMFSKSGAADVLSATAYSDAERNTKSINSPAFSMIGESSPDWFYNTVDEDMIRSGLLPRFTIVEYRGLRPPSNFGASDVIPSQELIQGICTLATCVYKILQARTPVDVRFDSVAHRMNRDFDKECDDRINQKESGIASELWNRAHLKTIRLAALLAVGVNPYQPVIDEHCFTWAREFTTTGISTLCNKFSDGTVANTVDETVQMRLVLEHLVCYLCSDYSQIASYNVSGAMFTSKIVPYGYLQKKLRCNKAFKDDRIGATNALKRAILNLCENGDIEELPKMQALKSYNFSGRCYAVKAIQIFEAVKERLHRAPAAV